MENYTYEVITTPSDIEMIVRSDGAWISKDERNSDYQAYLKSIEAEQSTLGTDNV
jgi:hypothetical protein